MMPNRTTKLSPAPTQHPLVKRTAPIVVGVLLLGSAGVTCGEVGLLDISELDGGEPGGHDDAGPQDAGPPHSDAGGLDDAGS